jgi:predicted metal-dependent enzyme (double-stranded beta helix superfamily)
MQADTTGAAYTIEDFIADAKRIVPPGGGDPGAAGREAIGSYLRRLAASPEILARTGAGTTPRQGTHGMDIRGGEIHKEPDGTLALMLARFPHEAETPVHNHHSWGVVCVVAGRDRYVQWRRLDDGAQPGHAEVAVEYERILAPGEVVHFADPPGDIHSQQGHDGAPVWELVFFGRDPNVRPRLYFDPERRTVQAGQAIR